MWLRDVRRIQQRQVAFRLTYLRINWSRLMLPSVFIVLIHYICFSGLALRAGSKTLPS